jgi:hypothetical protein
MSSALADAMLSTSGILLDLIFMLLCSYKRLLFIGFYCLFIETALTSRSPENARTAAA